MKRCKVIVTGLCFLLLSIACREVPQGPAAIGKSENLIEKPWMLGPFERPKSSKPIIQSDSIAVFDDPMSGREVAWRSKATFNPAALVRDGEIHVFYRAEQDLHTDSIGGHTSRIGLAVSEDGVHYQLEKKPVFYPDDDDQKQYEWIGGTEDPRIVEDEQGRYILTYTQWNGDVPRLALATSEDLRNWTKHGPIFEEYEGGKYHHRETKSGAIVTELKNGKLVAAKINGTYYMYFGVPHIWLATSTDLIDWTPVEDYQGKLAPVLNPRPGYFDSWLVEAGPPPVLTDDGIVVLYNAGNSANIGVKDLGNRVYTSGQALFSAEEPWKLLDRSDTPYLKPELPFEKSGQYKDGTTFVEGLVYFDNKWYLYYGTADSMVGVAVADAR
ncbi:glycoside hydrolase family 130 protein [Pricia sp. S334]|uniref:Glycoside hydrolase family 130 protein n=1 Tax=Pricia mediterranea TaxID=3076079 RepID=A0ABU3L4M1_9FLAO|nr:glycoside hydrolase family 130 protein [Pricia sp. S334]MDT7828622.1 glycoside hydrolase family 130 protein [Pricia sp. S334]